jgi:hypothetical protein
MGNDRSFGSSLSKHTTRLGVTRWHRLTPSDPTPFANASGGVRGCVRTWRSLGGSSNGAQDDGHVEIPRVTPPVVVLVTDNRSVIVVEPVQGLELRWALGHYPAVT